jgi:2-dehydro-3-deoxyphosphooctonate aldolase (KDO 8-P synthase)
MKFAVQKVTDSDNQKVAIIERGNSFGYTDLIVDYRGIPTMREYAPVILDVTHSLQQPNQSSELQEEDRILLKLLPKQELQ